MLRATRFCLLLILFVQLVFTVKANGFNESYVQSITGKLKQNDSCVVIDDKFENLALNKWNQLTHLSVTNLVSFELRSDTSIFYHNKPFTCTLNVSIKYFISRDQTTPDEINNIELVVKYDSAKGATYPTIAQYRFKDAFRVAVTINSIISPELGTNIPAIFRLKNQIFVERRYPFNQNVTGGITINSINPNEGSPVTFGTQFGSPNGTQLQVSWNTEDFEGSQEYDLEWTYFDRFSSEGAAISNFGGATLLADIPDEQINSWMHNNNTRVTLPTPEYLINMPYQDGYVCLRVRGVYYNEEGVRLTTNWVYRDPGGMTAYCRINRPHNPGITYQYTASFAEEGKRKELISYFDGTLKERQSITINNSDFTAKSSSGTGVDKTPTAVVHETMYDLLGRPTLDVLPAPTRKENLIFINKFNVNSSDQPYSYKDISITGVGNSICGPGVLSMATNRGASNYYSPQNEFLASNERLFDAYIPDANQKPFSLTQYTADNTGRIRRSWAAGNVFQPSSNSPGRPAEYFYGKPSQKELDRLFGSEAGNASHYLKNMVVDPNGQVSVTYLNASGKTIATALAGDAPANLEALPSSTKPEASTLLKRKMIGGEDFRRNAADLNMQASAVFVATLPGSYTIHYSVNPLALITQYGNNQQICSNCYYDIQVDVRDDCGNMVFQDFSSPFTIENIACSTNTTPVEKSFSATFPRIGEYTIAYTLRLSDSQIKWQTDHYIETNTDLLTLQEFFQMQLDELDLKGCYSSCEACKTLGTKEEFRSKVREFLNDGSFAGISISGTAEAVLNTRIDAIWDEIKLNCNAQPCTVTNACEPFLEQMKLQVRPGGQYGLYTYNESTQTYSLSELLTNLIPKLQAPEMPDHWFIDINNNSVNRKTIPISDLIREYINHPEWADEIVKYHVEYCSYEWCKSNEASYNFDRTIRENITSGQEASDKGYFDRTVNKLLLVDPFFASGGGGSEHYAAMEADLAAYSKAMNMRMKSGSNSYMSDKDIIKMVDWILYCKPTSPSAVQADFAYSWTCSVPSTTCRSLTAEWEMFRNLYLQLKAKYIALAKWITIPECKNCFIGNDILTNNGNCEPEPACASAGEFFISVTQEEVNCIGGCRVSQNRVKLKRTAGPATQKTKIVLRRVIVGHSQTYMTVILEVGKSEIDLGIVNAQSGGPGRSCTPGAPPGQIVNCPYENTIYHIQGVYCGASSCPSDPKSQAYKDKVRVFNDNIEFDNSLNCLTATLPTSSPSLADAVNLLRPEHISELNNYVKPNWEQRLKEIRDHYPEFISITNTQIEQMVGALANLSEHYLNSVTTDPNALKIVNSLQAPAVSPMGYSSFAEIFNAFIGPTLVSQGFSHYLLENVYPYDKTITHSNYTGFELSTTTCSNIGLLRTRYTNSGFTGTFHEYLKQQLKGDYILNSVQLADIEARCSVTPQCRYLNDYVTMPLAFTKNATNNDDIFVDCSKINTLESAFLTTFPTVTEDNPLYPTLYGSFMNQALGYALSFENYASFKNQCPSDLVLYNLPASPMIAPDDFACVKEQLRRAYERAGQEYDYYITLERKKFRNNYISTCLSNQASSSVEGILREYHYTLYYYDQSGNLVKTVPPEGVRFLTDAECEQVDEFRNFTVANCDGSGIPSATNEQATLSSIGNLWVAQTSKSLEMWLYAGANDPSRQVRWTTGNGKYMFQAAIHDKKVWIELYSFESTGTDIDVTLTNQIVADASQIPIQAWSHLVVHSTDFAASEWTVYLDGKKLTLLDPNTTPSYPYAWEISPGPTFPSNDFASVKHIRLYNRILTDGEVAANFRNSCMYPVGALAAGGTSPMELWARFNIPAPGSETTTGPGSTNEFVQRFIVPQHKLSTNYSYNSLNSIIKQSSPDGGTTEFWYDKFGRILASQNSEQKSPTIPTDPANRYSFTKYDALGRITEVGEKINGTDIAAFNLNSSTQLLSWQNTGTDRSLTQTYYDKKPDFAPAPPIDENNLGLGYFTYTNLKNRVAASVYSETRGSTAINATYYSYDITGNAKTVFQEIAGLKAIQGSLGIKRIDYNYDLISGKLNMLSYQKGFADQFFYKYIYDADNRLIESQTSSDNLQFNRESRHSYYLHGPLSRLELGNGVQGIDYAYTLLGWMKSINGKDLIPEEEIGKDGGSNSIHKDINRDELAFTLGYFAGDYTPIGGTNTLAVSRNFNAESFPINTPYTGTGASLYNGNISNTTLHLAPSILGSTKGYTYRYDQLNRLLSARMHNGLSTSVNSTWDKESIVSDYSEDFTYDANGNILTLLRNSYGYTTSAKLMDNFSYHYNKNSNGELINNKLRHVTDPVPAGNHSEDIDNLALDTYQYDKIGNLIADRSSDPAQQLNSIQWNVYGKIKSIIKPNGTISYDYDASGQRVKRIISSTNNQTFYVRSADGIVLGVYSNESNILKWLEQHIYGSSRIGVWNPNLVLTSQSQPSNATQAQIKLGEKTYELTNHLGNVLATISDKKINVDLNNDQISDYSTAELLSVTDYFAFGMQMPGRKWNLTGYRFGFNGKENDNEVKGGEGLQQDYGMRIYDPRLGRFLSVDPLADDYPSWSPYPFAMNRPIDGIDLDGLEWAPTKDKTGYNWVGYNEDGTPKAGSVSGGSVTNGNFIYTYSSDQSNKSGSLTISPINRQASTSWYTNKASLFNYTINIQQNDAQGFSMAHNRITGDIWNIEEKLNYLAGTSRLEKVDYVKGATLESYGSLGELKMGSYFASLQEKGNLLPPPTNIETDGLGPLEYGLLVGELKFGGGIRTLLNGGLDFKNYKLARGGGKLLGEIPLNATHPYYGSKFPVFREYDHVFIKQWMQRKYNLPNWLVNNWLNVRKTTTLMHANKDLFRYRFLPREIKRRLGPGGDLKYNMFRE